MASDICIISTNRLENEAAARNRIISFIHGMKEKGFKVHLVSMDSDSFILDTSSNFTHHKFPFTDTKTSNFFKRTLLEIRISIMAINKANEQNSSFYLITIPSMFLLFLSFLLKKKSKKILDIRDLSWEYLSNSNIIHKFAKILFKNIAIINFKIFDLICVTNQYEYEYLDKRMSDKQKLLKIPNGISTKEYLALSIQNEEKIKKNINITYVGNVGLAQDLSTFVEVSKRLPNIIFNIVGDGTDLNRIKNLSQSSQNNLNFFGRVSFDRILEIYKSSDILYAQLTQNFSGAMPSKLYEYLSTGKCIIFAGEGVASSILKDFENIHLISPNDLSSLESVIKILENNKNYKSISMDNINQIGKKYLRESSVNILLSEIENLIK